MSTGVQIGQPQASLQEIRESLKTKTLNSIRGVLPDEAILRAFRAAGFTYRERLIPPIVTILHMILAAIWPEESFAASWQVVWTRMVSELPEAQGKSPSSGSVAKARKRIPLRVWEEIFSWLSEQGQIASEKFGTWLGLRVVLLDGTTVSMPDERSLVKAFGRARGKHGKYPYPLARLVTLSLADTMMVIGYRMGRYDEGECALAWPMLAMLKPGDILVADRHYAAAHYYARYRALGFDFLTRAHQRLRIEALKPAIRYAPGDFVAMLQINPHYGALDPNLPEKVAVRFTQATIRIRGRWRVIWLATSLLDAKKYPAAEIVKLYGRRWRIETLLAEIKIAMGADVLRSKTPDGVRKELAARMIAVNAVRAVMLEAAIQGGVDPVRLSFAHAVRAILSFVPSLGTAPLWKLPHIYRAMLAEIASHVVPYRPGRDEPRAVRRRHKDYPTLQTTRAKWRLANVA